MVSIMNETIEKGRPPIEFEKTFSDSCQSDPSISVPFCFFCNASFSSFYLLQAHLATQEHLPLNQMLVKDFQLSPTTFCILCNKIVNLTFNVSHSCIDDLASKFKKAEERCFSYGNPLTCILCAGEKLHSFYHLIIHIVVKHGQENRMTRNAQNLCPFCHSPFNTEKRSVIEYHAVKEHMPELFMESFKEMQPENSKGSIYKCTLPCKIPCQTYERSPKKKKLTENCAHYFKGLPLLISHLQSQHYTIPKHVQLFKGSFSCRYCLYSFSDSLTYQDHIKRKHEFNNCQRANYVLSNYRIETSLDNLCCFLCWQSFKNCFYLQAHIQAAHLSCWRRCGICGREYSKFGEVYSATIIFMEMAAHERFHARLLEAHAFRREELERDNKLLSLTSEPESTAKYFAYIDIDYGQIRRQKTTKDYTSQFQFIGARNKNIQDELFLMGDLA